MKRKEFLSTIGMGAGAIACSFCFLECEEENTVTAPPANVDFTLELSDSANSALNSNGGFVYKNGVIIARIAGGTFVALSQTCTHQGTTVSYELNNNRFHCPNHGSNYATNGSIINGPATSPLTRYNTQLTDNMLRVFS